MIWPFVVFIHQKQINFAISQFFRLIYIKSNSNSDEYVVAESCYVTVKFIEWMPLLEAVHIDNPLSKWG